VKDYETEEDPGEVVIDEVAGVLLSALMCPWTPVPLFIAFLSFRLFDIWKPFPVRTLEQLPGGIGVMADDLAAGVYALVFTTALLSFLSL
jgi:phosphatidylglycerophosphatase A